MGIIQHQRRRWAAPLRFIPYWCSGARSILACYVTSLPLSLINIYGSSIPPLLSPKQYDHIESTILAFLARLRDKYCSPDPENLLLNAQAGDGLLDLRHLSLRLGAREYHPGPGGAGAGDYRLGDGGARAWEWVRTKSLVVGWIGLAGW